MGNSDGDSSSGRKALGRGLDNLIPDRGSDSLGQLFEIPVDEIERPPDQPRTHFDEAGLEELADSIAESGVIQPLVVRDGGDGYELIAGERRLRASKRAGLDEVPVVLRDVSDAEAYALALVENIQREDLNPIEEARACERLKRELGLTQAELAEHLGKSRSSIANATRLLDLPEAVQQMLVEGDLSAGHARALVSLSDEDATRIAAQVVENGLTVRETEKLASRAKRDEEEAETASTGSRYRDDAQVKKITDDLQRALGTKVELKDRHGKGRVEIHYDDYEILQSVLDRILEGT
jgi:ParB family chromosome partitioning protein